MPHIVIQLSGQRDAALGHRAVVAVNRITAEVLGKQPQVMATTVQYIPDEDWFIAGQPLSETGGRSLTLASAGTTQSGSSSPSAP